MNKTNQWFHYKRCIFLNPGFVLTFFILYFFIVYAAHSQENLQAILERGYVRHWLVCGPFESDMPGGVRAAIESEAATLGDRDYMLSVGGMAVLRPQHLQRIPSGAGEVYWQRAGVQSASLDLAPFFPEEEEGVAFAAFYAEAEVDTLVLINLQTPFGARAWFNGQRVRDVSPGPPEQLGLQQFVLRFRAGMNLFLFQIPFLSFAEQASLMNVSPGELAATQYERKPLLETQSGYELGLRLQPVNNQGDLYYVPRLRSTGTFSGFQDDMRQDAALSLFYAGTRDSMPVSYRAIVGNNTLNPVEGEVDTLPAAEIYDVILPLPLTDTVPGLAVPVGVTLEHAGTQIEFSTTVNAMIPTPPGRVYVVTGYDFLTDNQDETRVDQRIRAVSRQLTLAREEPAYGFQLGALTEWLPAYMMYPEHWAALRDGSADGRIGALSNYGLVDPRWAGPETLWRSLVYGHFGIRNLLRTSDSSGIGAYSLPGLAWQQPQWLRLFQQEGVVSTFAQPGLTPLQWATGPDGSRLLHRRKQLTNQTDDTQSLLGQVKLQRRELADQNIQTGVFLHHSLLLPPDPYLQNNAATLQRSMPSVVLYGNAEQQFFSDLQTNEAAVLSQLPYVNRRLTLARPGELLRNYQLLQTHAKLEALTIQAETWAVVAGFTGADYPAKEMDYVWRLLIKNAVLPPEDNPEKQQFMLEMLDGLRTAAVIGDEVLSGSRNFLAAQINTSANVPDASDEARAFVVFNSTPWERSGTVYVHDLPSDIPAWKVTDDLGNTTSAVMDVESGKLSVAAEQVPALGYRVYYATPDDVADTLQRSVITSGMVVLENKYIRVRIDSGSGDIMSMTSLPDNIEHLVGASNQILALPQSSSLAALSANGVPRRPDQVQSAVLETSAMFQRLQTRQPFLGGILHRTYTLHETASSLECQVRMESIPVSDNLLLATFQPRNDISDASVAPVYGERQGFVVGGKSAGKLDYRLSDTENISGNALQPAYDWVSVGVNDALIGQDNSFISLGPVVLVVPEEGGYIQETEVFVEALARRGIPAVVLPDNLPKPDFLWTDSTQVTEHADELLLGASLFITVGNASVNDYTAEIISSLSETDRDEIVRLRRNEILLKRLHLSENNSDKITPVLFIGGNRPDDVRVPLQDMAEYLISDGGYVIGGTIDPNARFKMPEETPGLALLFQGTHLASLESDDTLVLALGMLDNVSVPESLASSTLSAEFNYAVYPYRGNWRAGKVVREAANHNAPLSALSLPIQDGRLPTNMEFMALESADASVMASSVKPAGYNTVGRISSMDGINLRVWEAHGNTTDVDVRMAMPITAYSISDNFEVPSQTQFHNSNTISLRLEPNRMRQQWILPASTMVQGSIAPLALSTIYFNETVPIPYWRHDEGVPRRMVPVTLRLEDTGTSEQPRLEVTIGSLLLNETIQGIVRLEAPDRFVLEDSLLYFQLAPGAFQRWVLSVETLSEEPSEHFAVVATIEHKDHILRTVLDPSAEPFSVAAERSGDRYVQVTVQNDSILPLLGYASTIILPEYWAELHPEATGVLPHQATLNIMPDESQEILFRLDRPGEMIPMTVKVALNNRTKYISIP